MPPGDAQRAWFPEMLDELRQQWSGEISWEELAAFCHRMTEKRARIKQLRGIGPLKATCNKCGGNMVLPPISIRSALFALQKIAVIDEAARKKLERDWNRYRKENELDAYGNTLGS